MDVSYIDPQSGHATHFCLGRVEDFAECFPLYVEEDRNGSSATYNSISDYIGAQAIVSILYLTHLAKT